MHVVCQSGYSRRRVMGTGIAVGGTALAGCLGPGRDDDDAGGDGSYTVSLDHMGETEFPGRPYPEIPVGERLFDRDRVASIVTDGAAE